VAAIPGLPFHVEAIRIRYEGATLNGYPMTPMGTSAGRAHGAVPRWVRLGRRGGGTSTERRRSEGGTPCSRSRVPGRAGCFMSKACTSGRTSRPSSPSWWTSPSLGPKWTRTGSRCSAGRYRIGDGGHGRSQLSSSGVSGDQADQGEERLQGPSARVRDREPGDRQHLVVLAVGGWLHLRRVRDRIDERGQRGHTGDAVGDGVVHLHEEPHTILRQAGQEPHLPQRPGSVQRAPAEGLAGEEELFLISRRRHAVRGDVRGDVERLGIPHTGHPGPGLGQYRT
jgi:hypothetical protein